MNRRTVTRWTDAHCDRGMDGLRPRTRPGQTGHIPVALADEIKRQGARGAGRAGLKPG